MGSRSLYISNVSGSARCRYHVPEAIVPLLERRPELFPVVEIEPQTTWIRTAVAASPYRVKEEVIERLLSLPGQKLIHSVGTPVGGSVRPEPAQLALLRDAIARFEAPWVSDHLSFNQTPEFATGFFLPPRQTHRRRIHGDALDS